MLSKKKILTCKVCKFSAKQKIYKIFIKEKKVPLGLIRKSLVLETFYYNCSNCSSINYIERSENSVLNYNDKNYDEKIDGYFYSSDFTEFLYKKFKSKLIKVLEVGPGTNSIYSHLKLKLNISEIDALEANENLWNFNKNFNSYFSEINQIKNKYDMIIGIGVLEHIDDPFKFLRILKEVNLNEDGLIVFQYPNIRALNRILMNETWDMHHEPGHVTIPSIKSFRLNNFKVIKTITSTKLSRGRVPFYAKRNADIELKYKRYAEKNYLINFLNKLIFRIIDKFNLGETITVIAK